jgi:hypothetical protein
MLNMLKMCVCRQHRDIMNASDRGDLHIDLRDRLTDPAQLYSDLSEFTGLGSSNPMIEHACISSCRRCSLSWRRPLLSTMNQSSPILGQHRKNSSVELAVRRDISTGLCSIAAEA